MVCRAGDVRNGKSFSLHNLSCKCKRDIRSLFQEFPHGTSYFIKASCVPAMSINDCQSDSLSM